MQTSNMFLEGTVIFIDEKKERKNEETGEIVKKHYGYQFLVDDGAKGYEVVNLKDLESKYIDEVEVGKKVKLPFKITAMINQKKYYSVV